VPGENAETFEKLFEYFRKRCSSEHDSDLKLARAILKWASNNCKASFGMTLHRSHNPATPSELMNMSGQMSEVQLFEILFRY